MSARQRSKAKQQKHGTSSSASLVSGAMTPSTASEAGEETSTVRSSQRHSTSRVRSSSPLNISRVEEKEEIAHLNNRLANYIDYVHGLEQTKQELKRRVTSQTESQQVDVSSIREQFQSELTTLRSALDDVSTAKAKAEMAQKRAEADLQEALKNKRDSDDRAHQLTCRVDQLQKQLDKETLVRTKLENRIQSLQEEVDFQARVHKEEISQMKKTTVLEVEEEVHTASRNEYKSRLADELRALRDETAEELEKYRSQLEADFDSQFQALQAARDNQSEESRVLREESTRYHHQWQSAQAELEQLRSRCARLESDMENERNQHEKEQKRLRDSEQRLRDDLEIKIREFTELMAVKIALDQEILTYRTMLEGEESRLHIPAIEKESSFSSIGRSSTSAPSKRRRVDIDEEDETEVGDFRFVLHSRGNGKVVIEEIDKEHGNYVRLVSRSAEDVPLASWQLKYKVDGKEIMFKFGRSIVLKPNETITIWSSDANQTHEPPSNLVMKGQKFSTGKRIEISLVDEDGEEQAGLDAQRDQSERRVRGHSLSGARMIGSRRQIGAAHAGDEKCLLM